MVVLWLDKQSVITPTILVIVHLPETLTQVACKSSCDRQKSLKGPETSLVGEK